MSVSNVTFNGTLNPRSNGLLYTSNTAFDTLAVDGWYIWYSDEGPGRAAAPPSPLLAVSNLTAHPSTTTECTNFILFDVAQ